MALSPAEPLFQSLLTGVAQLAQSLFTFATPLPARVAICLFAALLGIAWWLRHRLDSFQRQALALCLLMALSSLALLLLIINSTPLVMQNRYSVLLLPPLWCALAIVLSAWPRGGMAVLVLLLGINVWGYRALLRQTPEDYRGAARLLQMQAAAAPVLVMAHYLVLPLGHYWPEGRDQLVPIKLYADDAAYPLAEGVPEVLQESREAVKSAFQRSHGTGALWVVLGRQSGGRFRDADRGGEALIHELSFLLGEPEKFRLQGIVLHRFEQPPADAVTP